MQRPLLIRQSFVFVLLICFAAVLIPVRAGAQAVPIKEKKADLSTFVGYTRLSPDYGPPDNDGVVFGAFYTRYLHWFAPAVEFRAKIAHGTGVGQKTYGGGVRVEKSFRRFRPYGDFLVSYGSINYHLITPPGQPALPTTPYVLHTYTDSSVVYTYGGGLDFDLTERLSARGEYQHENWSLGKYEPVTLTPAMWGFGVVYRIPFRPHLGR